MIKLKPKPQLVYRAPQIGEEFIFGSHGASLSWAKTGCFRKKARLIAERNYAEDAFWKERWVIIKTPDGKAA